MAGPRGTLDLTIRLDTEEARKLLGEIPDKHIRPLLPQAINATLRHVRTETIRAVSRRRNVPARFLRTRVTQTRRARVRSATGELRGNFSAIPYPKLGNVTQTRSGARVPRKGVIPGSFVARMPSGHLGVWKRRQPTRTVGEGARRRPRARGALPINEQKLFLNPIARREMERLAGVPARKFFVRDFDARLAKRLERLGAR